MEGRAAARACLQSLLESEFLHKVVETFAARVALVGIGLITTVVVARVLGPEGRGLYAAAVAIGAIGVQLGNLGLHASNTYYVARERRLMPALLGNTLLVSLVLGGSTSTAAWLVFSQWPHLAPVDDTLLLLALAWIPCALAYMLMQNLLLGIQEVRAFNAVELATKTLAVGFIAALALMERVSVEAVLASGFVPLGLGLFWIWQRLKTHLDRLPTGSLSLFKESIQYGLRAYLAALFSFLVLRADLLMLSCMVGPEQTGCYSIAAAMADMVGMLPVVIGSILFPRLSALNDRSHKWRLARKAALATGGIMAGVVLIAGLLAQPVVHLMFGTAFFPAVPAFLSLLPGMFALSVNVIFMNFFASIGMPLITVISPCVATISNILLNLHLIPRSGIVGSAVASSISYLLMALMSIVYIFKSGILTTKVK